MRFSLKTGTSMGVRTMCSSHWEHDKCERSCAFLTENWNTNKSDPSSGTRMWATMCGPRLKLKLEHERAWATKCFKWWCRRQGNEDNHDEEASIKPRMLMTITLEARIVSMVTLEARAMTKTDDASNRKSCMNCLVNVFYNPILLRTIWSCVLLSNVVVLPKYGNFIQLIFFALSNIKHFNFLLVWFSTIAGHSKKIMNTQSFVLAK